MRISGSVAVLSLCALLAGCSASGGGASPATSSPATSSAASSSAPAAPAKYYVSIGDSYAAGYQPTGAGVGTIGTKGFSNDVVTLSRADGTEYTLENFGCAGATTGSVLNTPGCESAYRAVAGPPYTVPQAQAAEDFIKAHTGQIGLVTISVGGNDVTKCGAEKDAVTCLTKALPAAGANIKTLVAGVRAAVGAQTPIVGLTYPDVFLGELATGPSALASQSVTGFKLLINPTLKAAYESSNAMFVDVTDATGAYGSMTEMTTVAPYGELPTPVAKVCTLTYYCKFKDIHPTAEGYQLIAQLVVDAVK